MVSLLDRLEARVVTKIVAAAVLVPVGLMLARARRGGVEAGADQMPGLRARREMLQRSKRTGAIVLFVGLGLLILSTFFDSLPTTVRGTLIVPLVAGLLGLVAVTIAIRIAESDLKKANREQDR